jgi:hypothetical protein
VFDTFATTGGNPMASKVGNVINVPEPTTAFIAPAPTPANPTRTASRAVIRRPTNATGTNGGSSQAPAGAVG